MNAYTPGQLYKLFEEGEIHLSTADLCILQEELQRVIDFLRVIGESRLASTLMREQEAIDKILRIREMK